MHTDMHKAPLVLLPGLLCDDAVWAAQVEGLSHRADSVVVDYGLRNSLPDMARHVVASVPFASFSLAGHSMGGRVALEVARLAPQRVRRLALLDTGYEPLAIGAAGEQEAAKRYALLERAHRQGMRDMATSWAAGMVHPDQLHTPLFERILDMVARRSFAQFDAQIAALLSRPDAEPVLRRMACPTWLICGRQDAWSPFERHEIMFGMLPSHLDRHGNQLNRLVAIEHCGHMSTMERADEVTALLESWLNTAGG